MIHRTPFFLPWLYPSLHWRMPSRGKELYLTFDDGPVPGPTEFVLDTLNTFDVKATFFSIGENIKKHPSVFQNILKHRHAIGNHTFNHLNGWKTNTNQYLSNVGLCNVEMQKHVPHVENSAILFRPPYGRIKPEQIKSLEAFKIIMWDVLPMDYNKNLLPEKCLKNTIDVVRPGSIVVFHDSHKAEKNLTFVLPRFIEQSLNLGFTFKVIT